MSMNALVTAIQAEIVSDVVFTSWANSKNCGVRGGRGRPPASSGELYLAVGPAGWSPGPTEFNEGIDELYAVDLTFTLKTGKIPNDRLMGEAYLKATTGLEPRVRSVMRLMQTHRYTSVAGQGILKRANDLLVAAGDTYNITEPLRWLGNDEEPTPQGPDWFFAQPKESELASFFGWSFQLHYGEARRSQPTAVMK